MTYQAGQDSDTAQETEQSTHIIQQAQNLRDLVRNCSGAMNTKNIVARQPNEDFSQPYKQYPGCAYENNAGVTTSGDCSLGVSVNGGSVLMSNVKNIWCPGTQKYLLDSTQGIFDLKSIDGFGAWNYSKLEEDGVYIQIISNPDNSHFAAVLEQVRSNFSDNELTVSTTSNSNTDTIGIYIYRHFASADEGPN